MKRILVYIVSYMGFLWADAAFKIVDSEVTTHNGGDAALFIESSTLRLRFICDRTQLFLDLQPTVTTKPNEWFSVYLVRRMLTGDSSAPTLLAEADARFLKDNLSRLEQVFSEEQWAETSSRLRQLRIRRSRERDRNRK